MSSSENCHNIGANIIFEVDRNSWSLDVSHPIELAVSLDFDGKQARAFGLPPARAYAVEAGDFVGDRRRGGSANCETVEMTPHGNGTHTEGVGHLTEERISVADTAAHPLLPATLLTVPVRRLADVNDSYEGQSDIEDQVICRADLQEVRQQLEIKDAFLEALVIRLEGENPSLDPLEDHSGTNPPYLSTEATAWLREVGCEHLLVELPSVDRESDGGTLPNHHLFFGHERGKTASEKSRQRTVTEMIAVPDSVRDGCYALSLRFPRFELDAAPSRPIIYGLRKSG